MLHSLRQQIGLLLGILVAVIIIQVFLTRVSQQELVNNQKTVDQAFLLAEQVYALERDIIDLQRNLLIFKETASDTSIERFGELIIEVTQKVERINLEGLNVANQSIDAQDISRMLGHLNDYSDNFTSVIDGRKNREHLYARLQENFTALESAIQQAQTSNHPAVVKQLPYNLAQARSLINQYLVSPDPDLVDKFNLHFERVIELINEDSALAVLTKSHEQDIPTTFNQLALTTRGYLFLVNVVMAGSANEFLYLAKNLRDAALSSQKVLSQRAQDLAEQARFESDLVSITSILIALIVAYIMTRRMISPITDITKIFERLSQGEQSVKLSGFERDDEIGRLAQAAKVFHEKNQQTAQLLENAQSLNTRLEKLNHELEAEKHKAEEAAQSKSMFLANMSHEIRTPMNGMVGLIDLCQQTELTSKQRDYLQKAAYSGQIMLNVINDILDFSKIEAGKLEIENLRFNVEDVASNVVQLLRAVPSDKCLDLRVQISSAVPNSLYSDPLRISQVLLNLCSNAIKFTDRGFIHVRFDFEERDSEQYLCIEVSDSGIGIDETKQESIFSAFTQADGSTSRKYGGTGLGLSIVKQLSELMGGGVSLRSTRGRGSCFTVRFKCEAAPDELSSHVENKPTITLTHYTSRETYVFGNEYFNLPALEVRQANRLVLNKHQDSGCVLLFDALSVDDINKHETDLAAMYQSGCKVILLTSSLIKEHDVPVTLSDIPRISQPISASEFSAWLMEQIDTYKMATHHSDSPSPASQTHEEARHSTQPQFSGHVLLVEDNAINQLVTGAMLENMGLSFDLAENGQQAIEKVMAHDHYDFILMDVQMPIKDGYQATREIRELGYGKLKICGLSANALEQDKINAAECGMNNYLTKPLVQSELEHIVSQYLDEQQA